MIETRVVTFYWIDSIQIGEWTEIEEFKRPMKAVPVAGLIVHEDEKSITLAVSICPTSKTSVANLQIPKSAIIGDVRTLCLVKMKD